MNKRAVLLKPSNKKTGLCSEGRKWVGVIIKLNLSQCLISHHTMKTCRNRGIAASILTSTQDGVSCQPHSQASLLLIIQWTGG